MVEKSFRPNVYKFDPMDFETKGVGTTNKAPLGYKFDPMDFETLDLLL